MFLQTQRPFVKYKIKAAMSPDIILWFQEDLGGSLFNPNELLAEYGGNMVQPNVYANQIIGRYTL